MSILISVDQKGARAETIKGLVEIAIRTKYPEASIYVARKEHAESRADRFSEALEFITDARQESESLRDELQEWYDNLPDNFQQGEKGTQLEDAISQLDDFVSQCEEIERIDVDFPGMY